MGRANDQSSAADSESFRKNNAIALPFVAGFVPFHNISLKSER
jgi:hypothetical protein